MVTEEISTLVLGTDEVELSSWALQLAGEPGIAVVARASQAERAVHICQRQAPRVAVLCLFRDSDLKLLAALLSDAPLPVVAIAARPELGVRALQAGATEVLSTSAPMRQIVESLQLMSQVHVVRPKLTSTLPGPLAQAGRAGASPPSLLDDLKVARRAQRVVGIGASTGGPPVLMEILAALPRDFPAAIVVAQHMPRDFHPSFRAWLESATEQEVQIGATGERLRPGCVHLAPGDADLELRPSGEIYLTPADRQGPVPSVDTMFRSLARLRDADVCGVLLTGMGRDGAAGLKTLRDAGALTLVQTRHSSAVSSMPESALRLDAADLVLAPSQIALELMRWCGVSAV